MTLPQFNAQTNMLKSVADYMAREKAEHTYKDRKIEALQHALIDARKDMASLRSWLRWHRERWFIAGALLGLVVGVVVGASL